MNFLSGFWLHHEEVQAACSALSSLVLYCWWNFHPCLCCYCIDELSSSHHAWVKIGEWNDSSKLCKEIFKITINMHRQSPIFFILLAKQRYVWTQTHRSGGFVFSHLIPFINEIGALERMRRSSVKFSGLVKYVTKLVTRCLWRTEVAIFAVDN